MNDIVADNDERSGMVVLQNSCFESYSAALLVVDVLKHVVSEALTETIPYRWLSLHESDAK